FRSRGRAPVRVHGVLGRTRAVVRPGRRERQARPGGDDGAGARFHPGVLTRRQDARLQPRDRGRHRRLHGQRQGRLLFTALDRRALLRQLVTDLQSRWSADRICVDQTRAAADLCDVGRRAAAGLASALAGDRLVGPLKSERTSPMKRLPLLLLTGLAVALIAACGGKPKPETPAPAATANTDSIEAAERARADSIARAEKEARDREAAEREAQQRRADSLAALGRSTEAVRTLLATMIHFDYDKALIRGGDASV